MTTDMIHREGTDDQVTVTTAAGADTEVEDTRDTRMSDMICTTSMSVISSSPRSLMLE